MRILPALCNWQCHLALPVWDAKRQRFCEPILPHRPIGVVHMTMNTNDVTLPGDRARSLRYPGTRGAVTQGSA